MKPYINILQEGWANKGLCNKSLPCSLYSIKNLYELLNKVKSSSNYYSQAYVGCLLSLYCTTEESQTRLTQKQKKNLFLINV